MRKPIAWMKELVPQKGLEWQVVLTAHEEMAKDWEQPVIQLYTKQEWVGLTKEEINQGLLRSFYVLEKARAWRDGVAWAIQQLKDKNNV